jgi:hypothetical protein
MATAKKTKNTGKVVKLKTKKSDKKSNKKADSKSAPKKEVGASKEDKKPKRQIVDISEAEKKEKLKAFADLRKRVRNAKSQIDLTRWELSEALYKISKEKMHIHWGYTDWKTYVQAEVGINDRTTQYYMQIYQYFTLDFDQNKPLPNAKKKKIIESVRGLHWTKSKCLVDLCDTDKNSEEAIWNWIDKAKTLPGSELEAQTKKALHKEKKGTKVSAEAMKTVSFKLAKDQLEAVDTALEEAGERAESQKKGHLLALICQDYVATTMAQTVKGGNKKFSYFNRLASMMGVHMICVDKETGEIVHGAKVYDQLVKAMEDGKDKK